MSILSYERIWSSLVLIAPLLLSGSAMAQNPHAGTWGTTELSIKEAAPGCRYVEVVTATFQLAAGVNNAVAGNLTRQFERSWWLASPACVMPGVNTHLGYTFRQDMWLVQGEWKNHDTQRLKGVYGGCGTDCKNSWAPPESFDIEFVRTSSGMSGGLLTGIVGSTMFRDSYQAGIDAATASEALMALLQPLLEGKCDEFLVRSVDVASRLRGPGDPLCAFSAQMAQLLPTIVRHQMSHANSVTLASVMGMSGPLILTEGDVLVQRYVVTNAAGNGIFLGAALRKQGNGTWKVLDLVP